MRVTVWVEGHVYVNFMSVFPELVDTWPGFNGPRPPPKEVELTDDLITRIFRAGYNMQLTHPRCSQGTAQLCIDVGPHSFRQR